MQDIDFDELDRAVSSLMVPDSKPQSTPKPEESPASVQPAPIEALAPVESVAAPTPLVQENTPQTPVARPRSSGRFMDMVHNSSDMKQRTAPVKREGVAISMPERSETDATPSTSQQVEPAPVLGSMTMPDPIDTFNNANEQSPVAEKTAEMSPSTDEGADQTTADSSESPFLSGAKVEKRPLNADPLAEQSAAFEEELKKSVDDEPAADSADEAQNGEDEPPVTPAIPELASDLVAIEAADSTSNLEKTEDAKTGVTAAESVSEKVSVPGGGSIAQQYTAKESTGDKTHAAIYDSEQYHHQLAHPAKKKSGWLWVLWVILLLAIGGGAAAGLYVLGIIP